MQQIDSLNFHLSKAAALHGSPFNTRQEALADKRVRQALTMAIDRETLVAEIFKGATEVAHSMIDVPRFGDSPNLIKYPYDPEKAKQLLTEAGWDPERKLRWSVGELPADDTFWAAINDYWAAVGVQAEYQINGQDDSVLTAPKWDFDLYRSAYPMGSPGSVAGLLDNRICTAVCPGLANARLEELFDAYSEPKTEEEYKAIAFELQDIISDEVPVLIIARISNIWGLNKRVTGLQPIYGVANNWNMESITVAG
jgi:peptide/nickel transport system substrate-binding protein